MLSVLYEDNHLLVIDKPANLPTMGAASGPTVHSMAAEYLKAKYDKPGNVYVGIVSRLDSMTSGVLVLARTSKAASRLVSQFGGTQQRKKDFPPAEKVYLAVVSGHVGPERGVLCDHVFKDEKAHRMRVADKATSDSQRAELRYQALSKTASETVLAVKLITGRKHQIRVQFADRGHAIIGDRKYGSTEPFASGVALHSWQLTMTHPTLRQLQTFTSLPPKSWKRWKSLLPEQPNDSILQWLAGENSESDG